MNMLGLVAAKVGMKAVGTAGSALYGAANAVAKTGQAFGMAGKALAGSAEGDSKQDTQPSNIVVGNFGMAGSAGRQKVTGGGTLPAPKAVAKPQVSAKMPTKALLDTVIKYLTSIDKTLKSQIEFDRRALQEQTQAEREAIIESKPSVTFSDIKNRLSGLKSDVKDNVSTAATIAKFALILGGAAALIANAMDQKELDALKENVDQFKKTFGWLGELGSMIPAGGILGFLFGGKGLKGRLIGGLVGILAEAVATSIFNKATGEGGTGDNTAINVAAAGAMGYLGYRGVKAGIGLSRSVSAIGSARAGMQASGSFAARRAAVSTVAADSAKTGLAFLKGPMWKRFLAFLLSRGKKELVRKMQQRIAIAIASGAVAATGVGAAFGAIGFLFNLGFSLFLMYEIYQLWQQFTASDTADKAGVGDAEIAKEINNPDATKVAGTTAGSSAITAISKSETGRPEEAQAFFEGKGWTKEQAAGIVGNLVVESRLKTDAVGDGGQAYGIAQWHPDRQAKFQQVYGKDIRQSSFAEQLEFVNWELNNSEKAAGNALREATTADQAAAIVDKKYERSAGLHLSERISNANAIMAGDYGKLSTGGASGYSSSTSADTGISGMVNAGAGKMGEIFGMLGSSVIKPGVKRDTFTPSTSNVSEQINNESTKLQNDITFGIKKEKRKDNITMPAISASTPPGVSPVKSVSSMDPNYSNMAVLTQYLAHFRLAA
jgi:hypothetical protein